MGQLRRVRPDPARQSGMAEAAAPAAIVRCKVADMACQQSAKPAAGAGKAFSDRKFHRPRAFHLFRLTAARG